MNSNFSFEILKKQNYAKRGIIHTKNGSIHTPEFVPVATVATVKSLSSTDLQNIGAQCALSNTYHLNLRPGLDIIQKAKGVRNFMNFHKPWFSDSGGFQAFSLGFGMQDGVGKIGFFPDRDNHKKIKKDNDGKTQSQSMITEKGVHFQSIYDGTKLFMDAKLSMHVQKILDSDIIMAFDECTGTNSDYLYNMQSLQRTQNWAFECLKHKANHQALYGIIQGSTFKDLREKSCEFTFSQPFEGIAIGGCLGETKQQMYKVLDWIQPYIAKDTRPIHLLGIGSIADIFEGVKRGCDTFDCVLPTRNARRGSLFISPKNGGNIKNNFHINIGNAQFKDDFTSIDSEFCEPESGSYTRAYLHHLYRLNELTYYRLASLHNMHFILKLMSLIRKSLEDDTFNELQKEWLS